MKSPVIIVGAARSGTSMMMSMIKNFLGYSGHNEAHFFTLLDQLIQKTDGHCQPLRKDFQNKSEVLLFDPVVDIKEDLKALFKNYIREAYGGNPWLIKTPNPSAIKALPLILELYPEASIIYMKRRGIENVLSQSRKFGDGTFMADYCARWSDCILSFFAGDYSNRSLVIDQLAYIVNPDKLIDILLDHLEIDATRGLKVKLKKYMLTNPVQKSAVITADYIPLEETPWDADEQETFLKHCEDAMEVGGYPLNRKEVNLFQPEDSFLFSGKFRDSIKVSNIQTSWNKIPPNFFRPFFLHPNAIDEEHLTLVLTLPSPSIRLEFKMVNPKLTGEGVTIFIDEVDQDEKPVRHIAEINLQCLETNHIHLQSMVNSPVIKVRIANQEGSSHYNCKLLEMNVQRVP